MSTIADSRQRSIKTQKQVNWVPIVTIGLAVGYLAFVLYIPAANVFYQAFRRGFGPFLANLTQPNFLHAV